MSFSNFKDVLSTIIVQFWPDMGQMQDFQIEGAHAVHIPSAKPKVPYGQPKVCLRSLDGSAGVFR